MSKYRSIGDTLRGMLGEQHAPALKVPEPYRVETAIEVLHANGIASAARYDEKSISLSAADMMLGSQILDNALMHGKIEAKPLIVSAEAIAVPDTTPEPVAVKSEPTPPEGGHKLGEEVEQIEELSKATLKSYVSKGNNDSRTKFLKGNRSGSIKRDQGVRKAAAKLGEEVEQIDELSKGTLKSYHAKSTADHSDRIKNKPFNKEQSRKKLNRAVGQSRSAEKLRESAVDKVRSVLAELAQQTLKSYIAKSHGSDLKHQKAAGSAIDRGDAKGAMHHIKKSAAKTKGFRMAVNRLKEDLSEGKKEKEAESKKASKAFGAHPRADKMHQDMMHAAKHFNYVQDATDHVYSNNSKHVKYGEWDAMKPHIEDHFRKHGLED